MTYVQIMIVLTAILPLVVTAIVGLLKKWGLSSGDAPTVVGAIAVIVALAVWHFYPNADLQTILASLMAVLASGTVYGAVKQAGKVQRK